LPEPRTSEPEPPNHEPRTTDPGSRFRIPRGQPQYESRRIGLGYVGSVSAANFAADGHDVIGVDVNPDKVAAINAAAAPSSSRGSRTS